MDFKLSKTHLLQQEMYRKFAENEVKPLAEEMDETEVYNLDLLAKMHKYGLMGIPYSKEYGGVGGDYLSYALCMEEISKVDGSSGITISVHTSLCCSCIDSFGTEEQKQKFLRPLIDGSKTGCFGLTEPNAGSDAAGQQTTAVYDEETDEYIINGGKIFTTNSGFLISDDSNSPIILSASLIDDISAVVTTIARFAPAIAFLKPCSIPAGQSTSI